MAQTTYDSDSPRSSVKSAPNSIPSISIMEETLTKCKSELDLVKNKSNLFLIKSYSFIDKTSKYKRSKKGDPDGVKNLTELSKMKSESGMGTHSNYDELLLRKKSVSNNNERQPRPKSLPASGIIKRESFLRQSFQSIRRSFSKKPSSGIVGGGVVISSSSSGGSEKTNIESDFEVVEVNGGYVRTRSHLGDLKEEEDESRISRATSYRVKAPVKRSTSSVSTLSHSAPGSPMAPLQGHSETQSVICLNNIGNNNSSPFNSTQPISSSTIPFTIGSKGDSRSLRQSNSTPLPLVSSSANLRSLSPNPKVTIVSKNDIPEKEKKRKEVSSSRLKKFHRHFTQVSKEERVINYFSCALVSDILLQGHLYITDHHFAFYSNVFGYVTKVVIPTSSVTKISKEKVAKIIPNAVGVATADERHVFGSFLSRESAFRLMCSVCPPETPVPLITKALPDVEISEEYSIEDDSSCSISGNESPPQPLIAGRIIAVSDPSQTLLRRPNAGKGKRSDSPNAKNATTTEGTRTSPSISSSTNNNATSTLSSKSQQQSSSSTTSCASSNSSLPVTLIGVGNVIVGPSSPTIITSTSSTSSTSSAGNGQTSSSSSSPNTVVSSPSTAFKTFSQCAIVRLKFPTEFNIVYLGVVLSIILAMFSGFLLYRILDIEAKTSLYRSTVEFNWGSGNDADVFNEALRWQKELQSKSAEEAQNILHSNLQQIAKVRRSLETLSMLIHDRSSTASSASKAEGDVDRVDTD